MCSLRRFVALALLASGICPGMGIVGGQCLSANEPKRPHILWLTCEDSSPNLGCYGDSAAITPNLDRLAKEGVRYTLAFSTSGVCAPSRSCLITGVYPSSLGTHFMRCKGTLPDFVKCFPEYLRSSGYYCTNNVKTDYNFDPPKSAWDESSNKAHWKNRPAAKPFFAVFNNTVTHESQYRKRGADFEKMVSRVTKEQRHDPAKVTLPPFYPDTPEARLDWAQYLDTLTMMDLEAGDALAELEQAGLADDTIVFFFSDHGVGLPRAKRWLYDSGTHVPLIVRFGKNFRHLAPSAPGTTSERLVSFVDFAPTVLSLARVTIPEHMQGVPFLGAKAGPPREYVFGLRDRMDETHDIIRSVRDRRFKYIRNYMPHVPYAQHLAYAELGPTLQSMRRKHVEGKLNSQQELFFRRTKPPEELFDCDSDPHNLRNLAADPAHAKTLDRFRAEHQRWMRDSLDLGLVPEPDLHDRCGESPPYVWARQSDSSFPREKILAAALTAQSGPTGRDQMTALLSDPDAAVRYWGVTGLIALGAESKPVVPRLLGALKDPSPTVRVTAARALFPLGEEEVALSVLKRGLRDDNPWVRHHAALALDSFGQRAAPLKAELEGALKDENEYVVRVATHALEFLKGEGSPSP